MMEEAPEQIEHIVKIPHSDVEVAIPTIEFNLVYQLNHLYRHLFDDGIGLRQVLDYYCILKAFSVFENRQEIAVRVMKDIESFGMKKFCRAHMYVMQDVFGMNESWQLCEQDMKAGEFLLSEIMQAGNFGHYDVREKKTKKENGVQRLIRRQRRNMRFLVNIQKK